MKANMVVAALLLFSFGCTSQRSDQISQQEMDQIKSDVKATVHAIIDKFEKLDAEGGMQYYWDSPEYIAFNADGSRSDYQTSKKGAVDFVNSIAFLKIPTVREDYTVLTRDLVICAWLGKGETNFKSGDKETNDPYAVTLVLKKIAGQWKVIHSHDSATITRQKAGKK